MSTDFSRLPEEELKEMIDAKQRLKRITQEATCNPDIIRTPFHRLCRSIDELYRQARIYDDECDYIIAFKLYFRCSTMIAEHLPKHPEYKSPQSKQLTAQMSLVQKARHSVIQCERLRPLIQRRLEIEAKKAEDALSILQIARVKAKAAAEQRDREMAERLQQEEMNALEQNRHRQVLTSFDPILNAPVAPAAASTGQKYYSNDAKLIDVEPSPPATSMFDDFDADFGTIDYPRVASAFGDGVRTLPVVNRALKPPVAHLADATTSQAVIVPGDLVGEFLKCAERNTAQGIETCGVLCGRLSANRLVITHCVVPKQNGGPDTCDTMHEHLVFEYQDKHDLLTVGWIHTHPTQTAFLSSVDLHTHYAYQVLLSESIAIVCSTKMKETGIFHLTPTGLKEVGECRLSSFHPHGDNVFQNCEHAHYDYSIRVTLVDFR